MPRRSIPSSVRSTTVGRPPPTEETATTTKSGTDAPDALVQREEPRRIGDVVRVEERGDRVGPVQAHRGPDRACLRPPSPPLSAGRRRSSWPSWTAAPPEKMTGADTAAADQTPAERDRRRRAPELCPTTPLAAAAGGEEHEGRARKVGRRCPGAARRRHARGERVRCGASDMTIACVVLSRTGYMRSSLQLLGCGQLEVGVLTPPGEARRGILKFLSRCRDTRAPFQM
jgi:hypothetical protein